VLIGTAGHIDHGKTALVKALTGVDADRLPEERARGITLDLGYAFLQRESEEVVGFVDVPGHERLVHNMLAGATGIDFVLLVVAADDGPMPQTREHVQILDLLGLSRGAVALTKTDLVDSARLAEVNAEVVALLADTGLAGSPVFPVSARTGEGVPALWGHLTEAGRHTSPRPGEGRFRLAVDRCFTLAGVGTVVTGTAHSGTVRVGERLLLSPPGVALRVRGIHAQNRPSELGRAGQRCALNLAGVDLRREDVRRGHWVLEPTLHAPTPRLDVRLRLLAGEERGLRHWSPVHVHLAAEDVTARVALLEGESLAPGAAALAQLVLDRPIGALHGDRFVLRDQSASRTVGGGVVLDPFAPARGRRSPERRAVLAALGEEDPARALGRLTETAAAGVDLGRLALAWNRDAGEIDGIARTLEAVVIDLPEGPRALGRARWQAHGRAVIERLAAIHETTPEVLGPNAEQLRRAACPPLDRPAFGRLLETLVREGRVARTGPWLHLPGHQVRLAPAEATLWDRARPLLAATPFHPPRVRDLARALAVEEGLVRMTLRRVAGTGQVYLVAHDHYFLRDSVRQLARIAGELAPAQGEVSAAAFRDRIATGRKLAIQILEFLDRVGFSRRLGDVHRVERPDLFQ
jgi:selenocysteine-specific elongation factor